MNINTFKAFRSRNYRLYFAGQSVSLIGTHMQRTAVYWLIYVQTHSAFMLGVAVFAVQFPSFVFSPLGGVVSDRYNRYKIMITSQIISFIQAALLVVVVMFTHYAVWEILALSVLLGTVNAFDVPARQSMVHQMVDNNEDLSNAIALNSSMGNLARLVGPALSGIVLEKFGAGTCFSINALSFLAVIASLAMMHFPTFIQQTHSKKVFKEFREGWTYLRQTPSIGFIILLLACVSLTVLPFITLLPIYAKVIFNGNASTFGYLNSAIGLGAISGAFFLASLKEGADLKRILFINLIIFGIGLILFSHIANFPLALCFAVLTGFGMMSQTTVGNTIIQTGSSPHIRGRVISYFAMAFFGLQPIGGLLIGSISQVIGAPNTLLCEGIAAIVIAVTFFPFLSKDLLKDKDGLLPVDIEASSVETEE